MKTLIMFFLLAPYVLGQSFPISKVGQRDFTLNKFDKIVYAKDDYTGTIYEYNLKTGESKESQFPNLPTFANKNRSAVYEKDKLLYLYNFEKDSTYLLGSAINYDPFLSFSPNDGGLLVGRDDTLKYFSFINNSIELKTSSPPGFNYYKVYPSWKSDSIIVISNSDRDALISYNTFTGIKDTLFIVPNTGYGIFGFDYNKKYDVIAYSYETQPNTRIHLLDMKTGKDSVVFHLERDMPNSTCADGAPLAFTYFKWAPDSNKLIFFGDFATNSVAGIYTYYIDPDSTVLQTDCHDLGHKIDTEWINNETVIFSNQTAFRVYSLTIPEITTSVYEEENNIPKDLIFQNYPNPFNSSTTLLFENNEPGSIELEIYNILGERMFRHTLDQVHIGKHSFSWNGRNKYGNIVGSGIYIARLRFKNFTNNVFTKSIKLQLIK